MPSTHIRLPGKGTPAPLFRFDTTQSPATSLMNLQRLETNANLSFEEQWQAPGNKTTHQQTTDTATIRSVASPHYQLLSLNLPVGQRCIRQLTQSAYEQLLALVLDSSYPQLVRCWNYIPNINSGSGDNEVYRQFCWGRADAIDTTKLALPAATGIGSADGWLRIAILSAAPDIQVQHWENPRQLSAYAYPRTYGPRSPSFARATSVAYKGESLLLLSGTSSIVDHQTQHPGDLSAQIAETRRNIDHLLAAYRATGNNNPQPQAVRFYLRNSSQLEAAQAQYQSCFGDYPDPGYFVADICRQDLAMEIEATFH